MGVGAEIGRPEVQAVRSVRNGLCKLRATQTESGSTIGEAWERCAKIGRGTDRQSVPSTVLSPGVVQNMCRLRALVC